MPPRRPRPVCPPDHGHRLPCYVTHKCGCGTCREVNAAYMRWLRRVRAEGRLTAGQGIDVTGTRRRAEALQCLGWSVPVVFARAGLKSQGRDILARDRVTVRTAAAVRRVYDELSATRPDPQTAGERVSVTRTIRRAQASGFADPLAWDGIDIDDPAAVPDMGSVEDDPGWFIDELAHLYELGESPTQAVAALGPVNVTALDKACRRHGRPDLARWVNAA